MKWFFLWFTATFSSILVVSTSSTIYAVIWLVVVFINVSITLVLINSGFIGLSYIIVYIGAIAILFLFVIQLLNIDFESKTPSKLGINFFLLIATCVTMFVINMFFIFNVSVQDNLLTDVSILDNMIYNTLSTNINSNDTTLLLSNWIYGQGMLFIVIISFILLIAMIGPIILCVDKKELDVKKC